MLTVLVVLAVAGPALIALAWLLLRRAPADWWHTIERRQMRVRADVVSRPWWND